MWTRKKTWPGENREDWLVLYKGISVGRVLKDKSVPYVESWISAVQLYPALEGVSPDMERALESVREMVLKVPDLEKQVDDKRNCKNIYKWGNGT